MQIKQTLSHLIGEIGYPNISVSLIEGDFEKLRRTHDSIHEFLFLPTPLVKSKEEFESRSAFLVYHSEAFDKAHRSFLEALATHYNSAYTLLRSVLELVIKGAFWDCLAHKRFRKNAEVLNKPKFKRKDEITILEWIDELIKLDPSIERGLEEVSASVFDKTTVIFENEVEVYIPTFREIVEQLNDWEIFDPIQEIRDPIELVYELYHNLSRDVHVIPDRTDIGRRIEHGKELFEAEVIPAELNKYAEVLHNLMDLGIVVMLNVLLDLASKAKDGLEERLIILSELELNYASTKILELVK